jgi:lysophospholipase L1-like esterase
MKTKLTSLLLFLTLASAGLLRAQDARPVADAANAALPTFHILGDSTVRSGGSGGNWGWGERIAPFFDTNKINIVNQAIAGRSARTYFTDGHWQNTIASVKSGDFLIIQFGTNDGGKIGDPNAKGRPDGAGIGDEIVEDTKADGTKEIVHTFGWYMAQFITQAQAKGATVILVSPIPHKDHWETGRDFATFAQWDAEVAKAHNAFFFDLTMVITDAYKKVGADKVATFFSDPRTHTSDTGAQFNAACVIAGLKSLPGDPMEKYFSDKSKAVEPYKPAAPTAPTSTPDKTN